jgi:hypothetical protein
MEENISLFKGRGDNHKNANIGWVYLVIKSHDIGKVLVHMAAS